MIRIASILPERWLNAVMADEALQYFLDGYLVAVLWAETDVEEPLDRNYTPDYFHRDTILQAYMDCYRFRQAAQRWLKPEYLLPPLQMSSFDEYAGHDFWLSRQLHGSGFWDGDWVEPAGTQLTQLAKKFPDLNVEVGGDGMIHVY